MPLSVGNRNEEISKLNIGIHQMKSAGIWSDKLGIWGIQFLVHYFVQRERNKREESTLTKFLVWSENTTTCIPNSYNEEYRWLMYIHHHLEKCNSHRLIYPPWPRSYMRTDGQNKRHLPLRVMPLTSNTTSDLSMMRKNERLLLCWITACHKYTTNIRHRDWRPYWRLEFAPNLQQTPFNMSASGTRDVIYVYTVVICVQADTIQSRNLQIGCCHRLSSSARSLHTLHMENHYSRFALIISLFGNVFYFVSSTEVFSA